MTYMAFKVLRFLMLYKDFFIIKIPVTIPAPGLQLLLLLTAHDDRTRDLSPALVLPASKGVLIAP